MSNVVTEYRQARSLARARFDQVLAHGLAMDFSAILSALDGISAGMALDVLSAEERRKLALIIRAAERRAIESSNPPPSIL